MFIFAKLQVGRALVPINIARRSAAGWANAIWHSAYPDLDNCYQDYAQRNAKELATLLSR